MLLKQGLPQQALEEFKKETFDFLSLTGQAVAYSRMGMADQAQQTLQSLIVEVGESASYQIAIVYSQMGDADNAMSWLERGFNIRDPGLQYLGVDSFMDPIRDDPRFQVLLRKMNLGG
jgi:tetratricopeptide (TPR) repeat protein